MKQAVSLLTLISVASSVFASASDARTDTLYGNWKVRLSPEVRETARKFGMPEPKASFQFKSNGSFEYLSNAGGSDSRKTGRYDWREGQVVLQLDKLDAAFPGAALLSGDELKFNDFVFTKAVDYNVVGSWVYTNGRGTDPSIRISFGKDGSFVFRCSNAVSKGKFQMEGRSLTLLWTEVDGEKITIGTMKKTIAFDEDGSGFKIDRFQYVRG